MTQNVNTYLKQSIAIASELVLIFFLGWLLAITYSSLVTKETKFSIAESTIYSVGYQSPALSLYQITDWSKPTLYVNNVRPTNNESVDTQAIQANASKSDNCVSDLTKFFFGGGAIVLFFSRPISKFGDYISTLIGSIFLQLITKIIKNNLGFRE